MECTNARTRAPLLLCTPVRPDYATFQRTAPEALSLAQSDAIYYGGVVESVREDSVLLSQDGLEQAGVGVKTRREEDGVIRPVEGRDLRLKLLVDILG